MSFKEALYHIPGKYVIAFIAYSNFCIDTLR